MGRVSGNTGRVSGNVGGVSGNMGRVSGNMGRVSGNILDLSQMAKRAKEQEKRGEWKWECEEFYRFVRAQACAVGRTSS